jgi:hypothetical protein
MLNIVASMSNRRFRDILSQLTSLTKFMAILMPVGDYRGRLPNVPILAEIPSEISTTLPQTESASETLDTLVYTMLLLITS